MGAGCASLFLYVFIFAYHRNTVNSEFAGKRYNTVICEHGEMSVFNRIQELIDSRGISVYRFWKDTGIGRDTAYRLYNDRSYIPNGDVLDKICTAYRVQPGAILLWSDTGDSDPKALTIPLSEQEEQPKSKTKRSRKPAYDSKVIQFPTWRVG